MRKKVFISAAIIFAMICVFALIDFKKVINNQEPTFCFYKNKLRDGGTVEYIGLGYKIIDFHRIEGISSYYGGVHVAPLIIHSRQVYKSARNSIFTSLGMYDMELYNVLEKFYNHETLNKLFSETKEYNKKIERKYKIRKVKDGIEHISYKHGYNLVPPANSEVELYELAMEAYNNANIDISDKTFLYNRIDKFYKENRSNLDNDTKSPFEIFFYGFDYNKVTY